MNEAERVLAKGGEAGAIARSVDWSKTAIGPVEGWSQALKSAASLVLQNHFDMLLWWGPEYIQIYNDAYRPVLGDKHPRAMGQPFRECWAEVWDVLRPMVDRPFRGGEATTQDDIALPLNRRLPREEAHFRLAYSPVLDDTVPETGIGGVLAVVTEITEEVYGERQLRTLRELAARSAQHTKSVEAACRAAVEAFGDNAWDVPFALVYMFDAGAPRLVAHVGIAPPSEVEALVTAAQESRATIATLDAGVTSPWSEPVREAFVQPLTTPDQAAPYGALVCGVSPHRVFDASYRGFFELAAGQVVTAIRNARALEEERKRAEALAEIDRAKSTFFSNVSHEFRTPLTLMLGPTEDALGADEPLSGDALKTVYRNQLRLLKLVNALLDFSRIEAGRMIAALEPLDLAAFTSDVASGFRSAIERVGLTFEVDTAGCEGAFLVDRAMWETIVLNLLSNALKFTSAGTIRVRLRANESEIELAVSDTGLGVAPHELQKLFERFHRVETPGARTYEGSGIGLALVQELAKLHGGTADVESELGHGSTFRVRIPANHATVSAKRVDAPSSLRTYVEEAERWDKTVDAPVNGEYILIADDNADMRDYVRRLLAPHWPVVTVADGKAALAAALDRAPALVLTDVMMPELDGFELLRALRSDSRTAAIPVVMLSARAGDEARVEGLDAGADDYLVKPFSARELVARVRTHVALAQARQRAEAAEQHRRLAFDAAGVGAWRVDLRTGLATRDAALNKLLGLPEVESTQPVDDFIERVHPDDRALIADAIRRSRETHADYATEFRIRRPDGSQRWLRDLGRVVLDERGEAIAITGAATDITELKRLAETALDAVRAKDEFLALLGHELRNPLAPIVTAVELMKLRGPEPKAQQTIERQVKHLTHLVDDLLDISRITRGLIELRPERLALNEVIAKAIEAASPLMEQKRHRLIVAVPSDLVIDADPTRMAQVFANLLTNASRYTASNGTIHITATRADNFVRIEVTDNGIGIAPEMLTRIFDLFAQGGNHGFARSEGGLGIGLSIVRNLVQLHGGTVCARSDGDGHGSTFEVQLPLATGAARPARRRIEVTHDGTKRRVLLVDDNQDAAMLLADLLRAHGHEVEVAHDGPQALVAAAQFRPDTAILDIGLPSMDGYELAQHLRESGYRRLIALTGYGQATDRARSREAGFDAHLVKPVDFKELAQLLEQLAS